MLIQNNQQYQEAVKQMSGLLNAKENTKAFDDLLIIGRAVLEYDPVKQYAKELSVHEFKASSLVMPQLYSL